MFISYEYVKSSTNPDRWDYNLIDSEFKEIFGDFEAGIGSFVIDIYEKRNLNVAANLAKAFIWYGKKYNLAVRDLIKYNKQYDPRFSKYEEDVNRYLILV